MKLNDVREQLTAPIPCKWKPEITTKKGPNNTRVNIERNGQRVAGCTAHIDARQVMDVLDSVVGPGNWSDSYQPSAIGQGVECTLTVLGVSKTDVGMPSSQDAEKGAYSDALKRAAVKFGIGRFLYDMDIQWLPFDGYKVTQKPVIIEATSEDNHTDANVKQPQKKAPVSDGKLVVTEAMHRKLHALGTRVYGSDWDSKRADMSAAFEKGSSTQWSAEEVNRVIEGLQKRANDQQAEQGQGELFAEEQS